MVTRDDEPVGPDPDDEQHPPVSSDEAASAVPDPGCGPGPCGCPAPPTDDERWVTIVADLDDLGAMRLPDPATARSGRDWDGTEQIEAAEHEVDEHEHFVPPEPPPVLGGDPLLTLAWFAVAGIPVFWVVVLAWTAPQMLIYASVVLFLGGLGVLFWRMPHRRDPDDDDTGAVV